MIEKISTEELYHLYLKANSQISTDTRNLKLGSMFFALKGQNFNANEFAKTSLDQGCSFAVVDEEGYANIPNVYLVENTLKSLQSLANYHRKTLSIPILAVTGSNGKTTNKELIKAVLSQKFKTLATIGNLNNHIGVPLTLLSISKDHEFAIIEMGANHQGEIDELCRIAEPDFGLITNIGKAHLEGFGGIEGVKKGKSELYKYLKQTNGKVFVNGDDDVLNNLGLENDKITYGCKKLYDVIGKDFTNSETVSFKYRTRYGDIDWNKFIMIQTQIIGSYNFINCLAACCIGNYFKVDEGQIKFALENYISNNNRSQLVKTEKNTLILDAYNANPNSMRAAIENFSKFKATEKIVLLGDMFELGEYSAEEHQKIVDLLIELNFKNIVFVGEEFFKCDTKDFPHFKTTDECKVYLTAKKISNSAILIKGSRGMKMETLKEIL